MLKRVCLVICLIFAMSTIGVVHAEENIILRYSYVSSISASLSINSGIAKAAGKVCPCNNLKRQLPSNCKGKLVAEYGQLSLHGLATMKTDLPKLEEQEDLLPATIIEFM